MGNTGSIPADARRRNGIIDAMSEYHRDKAANYQNQIKPGTGFGNWVDRRGMGQYYQNMHNQNKVQYHTGEKNMWNSWRT
ncbi:hypothetical protein VE04_05711 [Pseudogymnoascus sp. 24MN13]|nr:hypothetical protein VE04_05711 [Pseudogymnoascus sp. 24MN13]